MSNHDKIKSKPYRNWVSGALGLFYLQKGLYPFCDRIIKAEHENIVKKLRPCTSCAIEDILPAHASGNVCLMNKARCNCRKKKNRHCDTCSKIYDEIVLRHCFTDPHWVTDCSTWYNDHWQFAKCFLTTTSKGSNNTAADTDASGLLSIIINAVFFQSEIHCNIDPPNDSFSKVRQIRNEILHNSTLDITDQDLTTYLQSMITVLEDKNALVHDPAAQAATLKLKEILRNELMITTNEEACAIQTALNAIKVTKEKSEESIRKLAEESRNSLQQKTLNSTTGINEATKHAVDELTSTVATVFKETYEPEINRLKLDIESHENRLKAIEHEHHILQNQVAKLQATEERHQARIDYLKQKQGLQQYLVEDYQKRYVKTSVSPLKIQENVIHIRDVYVPPKMVVGENEDEGEGNTSKSVKDRTPKKKQIKRYLDLFSTDGKRNQKIFVVGDVGTGKSSFCKMMIHNWCSSITKRRIEDGSRVTDEAENKVINGEECNRYDMNQFDFLFYIPLPEMPKNMDDTVNMIKVQLKHYDTLVDNIFTIDSERCLILLDGLDEWTPSTSNKQSYGIPTSRLTGDSAILTTSRPSARGILNIKSSEYDLKVTLIGLRKRSVKPMIEQYMKLLNKTQGVKAFSKALSKLSFNDIHKAPMLLQQIIWLYCNNYDISHSRSSTYLHIVNAVLGWEHGRMGFYPRMQSCSLEQLPLPKSFKKFPRCQENRELLLLLGKIAYDVYMRDNDLSLVFGRYKLKQLGVSDEEIAAILQTGILTEVNCADPTYESSRLLFIHTSYVEYFAALYICSCYLSQNADGESSVTPHSILEDLISVTPDTSVTEIMRLENMLIMICGIVPSLTEHVCECIFKVTFRDISRNDCLVNYRIQDLTFKCLSEHDSNDQQAIKIKLRHLDQTFFYERQYECFSRIDPSSIETCNLKLNGYLPYKDCSLLASFLSQAVSLRTLAIKVSLQIQVESEVLTINLTNPREIQCITLMGSSLSVSGINPTVLQSVELYGCSLLHEHCISLSSSLSQATLLEKMVLKNIKCTKPGCEGHCINTSGNNHLQEIHMDMCDKIFLSGINPTCLTPSTTGNNHTCAMSRNIRFCSLSHEQYQSLCTFLSQAESLCKLELYNIKCIDATCTGHYIDLTNHKQLESLSITNCNTTSITGINHTCRKSCKISDCILSHERYVSLCTFLSHAESLCKLELRNVTCIEEGCAGHDIDLTNHKQLERLYKWNCNMTSVTSTCSIKYSCFKLCNISDCSLSHEQYVSLCTFLSHAESLDELVLDTVTCIEERCTGHDIDLTNHKQLESLSITMCNTTSISGINHTCVKSCNISDCSLSHEQYVSLCEFLTQNKSLEQLTLDNNRCIGERCTGHDIDLTHHGKLKNIYISDCYKLSHQ